MVNDPIAASAARHTKVTAAYAKLRATLAALRARRQALLERVLGRHDAEEIVKVKRAIDQL